MTRGLEQNNQVNNNNIQIIRRSLDDSNYVSSRSIQKEDLEDEFDIQRRKMEKGRQMCQFCKKKVGTFVCDCGCIVCKEHSKLKIMEGEGEKLKVCFVCNKIVKKVDNIKYNCNICFQNSQYVCHFKCGCALEVCKNCYIKCKTGSNKCPGCRAII